MSEPDSLPQVDRTYVVFRGRKYSFFAGCDYFRLSNHPEVVEAMGDGLKKYGLNVSASRVTTGNHALYGELETALAKFFGSEAALLVSNGYASNGVVAQTLRRDVSHVLIDAKAHVSLRDAACLFGRPILEFATRDPADLRRALARAGRNPKPILLTDGAFTYEGQMAPLAEYLKILGTRGLILLDDAHGAGVLGRTGRGTLEAGGVGRERIIQTVTLSKAFGVYGGSILCSRMLRKRLFTESAMFAGSTPLPLPLAWAALRSIKILQTDAPMRKRLVENTAYVKTRLRAMGHPVAQTPVPVAAITPASAVQANALRKRLLARQVYPSFIQYPGGPAGGYLRIVISSEHTRRQLDDLLEAVK